VQRISLDLSILEQHWNAQKESVNTSLREHLQYNQKIDNAKSFISGFLLALEDLRNFVNAESVVFADIKSIYDIYTSKTNMSPSGYYDAINYLVEKYEIDNWRVVKHNETSYSPIVSAQSSVTQPSKNDEKRKVFLKAWDAYLEFSKKTKKKSTWGRIPQKLNAVKEYAKHYGLPLTFEIFQIDFSEKFKGYMLSHHRNRNTGEIGVVNNTIHNILKDITTFLNWASKPAIGFNTLHHFREWKSKKEKTDRHYLTVEQLNKLFTLELKQGTPLDKCRDLWVFSAFTGMRIDDIVNFKPSCVQDGAIDYIAGKTGKQCVVGLNSFSKAILEKYNGNLPKQTKQHMNKNIKKVLDLAGFSQIMVTRTHSIGSERVTKEMPLSEAISFHSARRSFINWCISKNISVAHLSTMVGNDVSSLMIYYKKDKNMMKEIMLKAELA
jgi:site-specific recombinase XerD